MNVEPIIGTAWCFEDNINTDLIYPGRYLVVNEPNEMAKFALAGIDPEFSKKIQAGDMIVAGKDFGCGSSREQAALCLKYAGVSAIIAESFARIFYRNIINQGVPAIIVSEAKSIVKSGDKIELDLQKGEIKNLTNGKSYKFEPLPKFMIKIIEDGGIIPHLKKRLNL